MISGKDAILFNGRSLADTADNDVIAITFPNNLVNSSMTKKDELIYAVNYGGKIVQVTIRVILGSADDKYLNKRLNAFLDNPPAYVQDTLNYVKNVGDGAGNLGKIEYNMSQGVPVKMVEAKENTAGDTEQAIAIYQFNFKLDARILN
jgi:hypothetical protein